MVTKKDEPSVGERMAREKTRRFAMRVRWERNAAGAPQEPFGGTAPASNCTHPSASFLIGSAGTPPRPTRPQIFHILPTHCRLARLHEVARLCRFGGRL